MARRSPEVVLRLSAPEAARLRDVLLDAEDDMRDAILAPAGQRAVSRALDQLAKQLGAPNREPRYRSG